MTTTTGPVSTSADWPPLPLAAWRETLAALHLRTQMVGKTRLALSPPENHWWHVALYLSARGLATGAMPIGGRTLDVELDLVAHRLVARTSDGASAALPLVAEPIADTWRAYLALLASLGVAVALSPLPSGDPGARPVREDRGHAAWDADAVTRCFRALAQADRVLKGYRGTFLGKSSPSHLWWGSFDLACTRFSGGRAPPHPGGSRWIPDRVLRESYSHACCSAGWWPGTPGMLDEAAFYAYAYPEPPGYADATVRPSAARYDAALREWILPYEAVRAADDPDAVLRAFLDDTYAAAATLGRWDRDALERR